MLALMFVVFVVLLVLGLDLWYAMGMASLLYLVGLAYFGAIPIPLTLIPQQLMAGVDSFPLLAVPMFILAGELMTRGGVTLRLVNFSSVLVGHIKGGLAQVSVLANVIMAGMSGSAAADLAATGSLLIPGMVKRGYPADFASAVIASASTIGPVIPPSLPMVIIGSMVSVSVGQLFMGGVVPGLIMGLAMMIVVYRYAHRAKLPVEPRATRSEFFHALWDGALALAMPAIVLGSIVLGIATPTEAAVVAVVYAFIVGVFVYREIKWAELPEIFTNVAITSAAVMVTVAAAQLFGWITAAEGLGNAIGAWLTSLTQQSLRDPAGHQRHPPRARHVHGAHPDHAADGADPLSGDHQARHRSGALRRRRDAQSDDRLPDASGRLEPVPRLGDQRRSRHARGARRRCLSSSSCWSSWP